MKDYSLDVLDHYDIEVRNIRKTRGAVLCDSDEGVLLLCETKTSLKKMEMLEMLKTHIVKSGYSLIDSIFINEEGELFTESEDGGIYVLKKWFVGHECNVRKEREVLEATRNLARLHRVMRLPWKEIQEFEGTDLMERYERHNRELRKARKFIRNQTRKSTLECMILQNFEPMYQWAQYASDRLKTSSYQKLRKESRQNGTLIHGDYNYHNTIFTAQGIATTNFEHFANDIPMADLYYFMRKVMEKHEWNVELGRAMLRAYREIEKLTEEDMEYLAIRFSYPEKFWKLVNAYYHSNKAWIPEKTLEKLQVVMRQTELKKSFLKSLFSFHL